MKKLNEKKISSKKIINNINIINFGEMYQECSDKISYEFGEKATSPNQFLKESIRYIYDNPDFPKHKSILCTDKYYECFDCFKDGKWIKKISDYAKWTFCHFYRI